MMIPNPTTRDRGGPWIEKSSGEVYYAVEREGYVRLESTCYMTAFNNQQFDSLVERGIYRRLEDHKPTHRQGKAGREETGR